MGFTPDLPQKLLEDQSFIEDLARFADGVLTEKQVRQKWHFFDEAEWNTLGQSDELVEKIELEKTRRIRSGATKRELAQLHVIKGPTILDGIATDQKQSAKHRIDAIKALDSLAGGESQATAEQDRYHIVINLGNDRLVFAGAVKPKDPNDTKTIDSTAQELKAIPPRRGTPGRPPGSKNKPKTVDAEELLPFLTAKRSDEGGSGQPL